MFGRKRLILMVPQRGFEPLTHALRILGHCIQHSQINNLGLFHST
jgi:hypothetical protein